MEYRDIAVIGGGASGLAASIEALRRKPGLSVTICEGQDRVGKKLLVTGNGRCNLYNAYISDEKYNSIYSEYKSIAEKYGDLAEFFGSMGLGTYEDQEGRVYPLSNQASTVLNILRRELKRLGGEELCGFSPIQIEKTENGYVLTSETGAKLTAGRLIVAAGSPAGKRKDTNMPLYEALNRLGHKTVPFTPSLCPLLADEGEIKSLKGIRVRATVRLIRGRKMIAQSSGEVQFAEGYLSGICVMDLSGKAEAGDSLVLDTVHTMSEEELEAYLSEQAEIGVNGPELLEGIMHKALAAYVFSAAEKKDAASLTEKAKNLSFMVKGKGELSKAQVCSGGIEPESVNKESLESLKTSGVYFAGELLGVNGVCGGYNLYWAWTSGRCAGREAADSLQVK